MDPKSSVPDGGVKEIVTVWWWRSIFQLTISNTSFANGRSPRIICFFLNRSLESATLLMVRKLDVGQIIPTCSLCHPGVDKDPMKELFQAWSTNNPGDWHCAFMGPLFLSPVSLVKWSILKLDIAQAKRYKDVHWCDNIQHFSLLPTTLQSSPMCTHASPTSPTH